MTAKQAKFFNTKASLRPIKPLKNECREKFRSEGKFRSEKKFPVGRVNGNTTFLVLANLPLRMVPDE